MWSSSIKCWTFEKKCTKGRKRFYSFKIYGRFYRRLGLYYLPTRTCHGKLTTKGQSNRTLKTFPNYFLKFTVFFRRVKIEPSCIHLQKPSSLPEEFFQNNLSIEGLVFKNLAQAVLWRKGWRKFRERVIVSLILAFAKGRK